MKLNTLIGQLQLLAILEGISYISFGLTMPLKYVYGIKEPNYVVGVAHGALFMAYVAWVMIVHFDRKMPYSKTMLLLVASLVPFMTFWAEKRILKLLAH
jgi:integral membrane protein